MRVAIGADHGGFELKEILKKHYGNLVDLGTYSSDSCDYPDIAAAMSKKILSGEADLGILICGTGIGISIAANRYHGIRAAVLYDEFAAEMAKMHNNANVMVFGGRTMKAEDVIKRIDIFMKTEYEGGRHDRRLAKIEEGC